MDASELRLQKLLPREKELGNPGPLSSGGVRGHFHLGCLLWSASLPILSGGRQGGGGGGLATLQKRFRG